MSGILTTRQLASCLRVLRAVLDPVCATVMLTWGQDDLDAYVTLSRAGYVALAEHPQPSKPTAPFRWGRVVATTAGREYLAQIDKEAA